MLKPDFTNVPWRTVAAVILVLFVLLVTLSWCKDRERLETAKDQGTLAGSRMDSAQDAIARIGENAATNTAIQNQVEEAQNAIRQADPADRDRVARCELRKLQGRPAC